MSNTYIINHCYFHTNRKTFNQHKKIWTNFKNVKNAFQRKTFENVRKRLLQIWDIQKRGRILQLRYFNTIQNLRAFYFGYLQSAGVWPIFTSIWIMLSTLSKSPACGRRTARIDPVCVVVDHSNRSQALARYCIDLDVRSMTSCSLPHSARPILSTPRHCGVRSTPLAITAVAVISWFQYTTSCPKQVNL